MAAPFGAVGQVNRSFVRETLETEMDSPQRSRFESTFRCIATALRRVLRKFGEKLPDRETEQLRRALATFKSTDMKSVVFRYPEDLDGSKHLGGVGLINFEVVRDYMVEMSDALQQIECALDQFEEWER